MSCEWVMINDMDKYINEVPAHIRVNHHIITRDQLVGLERLIERMKNGKQEVITIKLKGEEIFEAVKKIAGEQTPMGTPWPNPNTRKVL